MRRDSLKFRVIIEQTSAPNDKQTLWTTEWIFAPGKICFSGSVARIVFLILNNADNALEKIGNIRANFELVKPVTFKASVWLCKSIIKWLKLAGWFGQVPKFDSFIFLEK